ncbi:MAG: riboflavin biosynthesis protein RibD [Flavobacteriales bacterium]|nr:MAG: riboflavin biosynthesis protein RibD [Flavobacteriales bacterium]
MYRCLELAANGLVSVAPNPMVGCVIVHKDKIIGEGYHREYGKSHAEPNAVATVKNKSLLKEATLYVNLEPCSVFSKTPPCTDLIIKHEIPKVIFGSRDTNTSVEIQGVEKLRKAGAEITEGILEKQCRELNKRFFTFQEKKRPYVILKWAQTLDGFIAKKSETSWITSDLSKRLVHKWRSEEQSIMVGTNTAEVDNPQLNVREWVGKNPTRIVIDKSLRLPEALHLFDQSQQTLVFTEKKKTSKKNLEFVQIDFGKNNIHHILDELHQREIISLIVEGGTQLLNSFLNSNLWDEARVFIGNKVYKEGVKAPEMPSVNCEKETVGDDQLLIFRNEI